MELLEAIKSRRSIRKFKVDSVADADIQELLEAARLAPSGTNLQPCRYVVVKSETARAKLNEGCLLSFVAKAPVVIACCVDTQAFAQMGERLAELNQTGAFANTPLDNTDSKDYFAKRRNQDAATALAYLRLNAAIAIDHMTLRAVDLGLGTCWVMMFDQDKVKQALQLDERYHVVALLPVGYPDQAPAPRPRLPLEQLVIKEL